MSMSHKHQMQSLSDPKCFVTYLFFTLCFTITWLTNISLEFFFFFFSSEYKEFIKFTKPSPIDEQQTKKEKKQKEGGKKKGKAQESGDAAAANAGEGIAKGIESMAVDQWCLLHMDS